MGSYRDRERASKGSIRISYISVLNVANSISIEEPARNILGFYKQYSRLLCPRTTYCPMKFRTNGDLAFRDLGTANVKFDDPIPIVLDGCRRRL